MAATGQSLKPSTGTRPSASAGKTLETTTGVAAVNGLTDNSGDQQRNNPEAAWLFIIKWLRESTPMNEFHLNCTLQRRIVQVDELFHLISGNGANEWNILIRIDADTPTKDAPHMGYEIYINGPRVQSGHAHGVRPQIGRPGPRVELPEHIEATGEGGMFMNKNEQIVDDFINNEIEQSFPRAALIVIPYGKILKQTVYGYKLKYNENETLIEQPELLTLDSMFDLVSLTKMYAINYALMHLIAQGKLSVDDQVTKYIPEYSGCNPENECRETRLIKDILTHTAGYAPSVEFYDPKLVSPDLYSQDKSRTEQIIEIKLAFQRARDGDQFAVYSDTDN
ncbi:unnamed protein product [Didymodactylos carnosus]|uniref:Beta-lactamase-related domain-containing protein n=1 Tax=Didymodactylos carnosus TaxID=1234261 RepID=A0A815DU22_9BILA|nr:unnamed protein product [Didymodactylos carnosus]CAF4128829.1 unnamed protein product [Didymodactylos carnosus]